MLKAYPFGDFLPDIASSNSKHIVTAKNVRVISNGYAPVKSFLAVTTALGGAFTGGGAFIGSDGTASLLGATSAALSTYSAGTWTAVHTNATSLRYRFAQFGDNLIYAHGGTLGSYSLTAGTGGNITGAPTAYDVATVRDFVVALGINGDELLVGWCAFNDSSSWPMDTTNQSDSQPLLSGGKGVAIVGGEYGIILQRNAIKRMSYVGVTDPSEPIIFQFDEISSEVGCMAQGSVANVGRLIFFLSERGFMMCDGETVTPIGEEKFNRWFFDTYAREDIANIWSAIDPQKNLVMWAMPGSPGRILAYNWVLQKAVTIETDLTGIFSGFTANISLEGVDTLYPDGLDSVDISLDDPSLAGGNPLLLIANTSNVIGTLAGDNMEATLGAANVEPAPGVRARVRSLRPVTDATNASAIINAKMRAGDGESLVSAASMRSNGKMPIRANGRYLDLSLTIPAGERWSYLQACEFEFEGGDGR